MPKARLGLPLRRLNFNQQVKRPSSAATRIFKKKKENLALKKGVKQSTPKKDKGKKQEEEKWEEAAPESFNNITTTFLVPDNLSRGKESITDSDLNLIGGSRGLPSNLLSSLGGSLKSTPSITPYKILSQERGKSGSWLGIGKQDINRLEGKIKELEC